MEWYGLGLSGSGLDPVAGFSEHGNGPLGLMKVGKFLNS
jgi:hypothetical protein